MQDCVGEARKAQQATAADAAPYRVERCCLQSEPCVLEGGRCLFDTSKLGNSDQLNMMCGTVLPSGRHIRPFWRISS